MKSGYSLRFISPFALSALLLTGCGGGTGSNSQPPGTTTTGATTYQLSVTAPASGAGTITSSPAGISCPGTCTAAFAKGTQVTLSETPGSNYVFGGWSGACSGTSACTVTMTAAESVNPTFTPEYGITVAVSGAGTVTSSPAGITCPGTCSAAFPKNTQVTLTETPGANSTFKSWTGCTGTTSCSLVLTAAETVTATFGASNPYAALNHIILFAQENRSFDHYFGYMRQYWANQTPPIPDQSFDGLPQFNPTSGIDPLQGPVPTVPGCQLSTDADGCTPDPTNPIPSFSFHTLQLNSGHVGTVCEENQSPFWNEAHNDWDYTNPADQPAEVNASGAPNPPLNGFVFTAAYDAQSNAFMDVNGVRAMGYFQDADLNFYYALATDFGTSDRWFSPVMDRTQINRAYLFAATSQGYGYPPGGGNAQFDGKAFTATTIFEALQSAGISWKIYVDPQNTSYYNPTTGVTEDCSTEPAGQDQDLCLAEVSYMNEFNYETQVQNPANNLWQHFAPISQFATDLEDDATFPQYALIEPASSAGLDEHPSDADGSPVNVQLGAQYVQQQIVQPFLQSPTWQDSAMIFTYDEAGGLYDHVSPQPATPPGDDLYPEDLVSTDICTNAGQTLGLGTCTFGWTGYRVPLVVISPYARQNFVSHTPRDTTAVLKMVETRFGLSQLTNRDGSQADMTDFFDFVNKPWATPPTLPAQTVHPNGVDNCDQTPPAAWNEPPEIQVQVTGSGTVSSSPSSPISKCSLYCTGAFSTGTAVTLTATPDAGSTFTGWGGACSGAATCTVTPTTLSIVTATFTP
jgi:phospholipase C